MKKKIALALTLALLVLPIGVFAANTDGNIGTGTGTGDVLLTVDGNTDIVYYVTVQWADLSFSYEYDEWDEAAHERPHRWTDKIGSLTVKNDSNGAIKFDADYEPDAGEYEDLDIKFDGADLIDDKQIAAATSGTGTQEVPVALTIEGTPKNADLAANTKIGIIKITVSEG